MGTTNSFPGAALEMWHSSRAAGYCNEKAAFEIFIHLIHLLFDEYASYFNSHGAGIKGLTEQTKNIALGCIDAATSRWRIKLKTPTRQQVLKENWGKTGSIWLRYWLSAIRAEAQSHIVIKISCKGNVNYEEKVKGRKRRQYYQNSKTAVMDCWRS